VGKCVQRRDERHQELERAIASRDACSSTLASSSDSSSIWLRSRAASARAAASRRRSSSITEPVPVSFPLNTTVEDRIAGQPGIRQSSGPRMDGSPFPPRRTL
jgi:hypothetical protein